MKQYVMIIDYTVLQNILYSLLVELLKSFIAAMWNDSHFHIADFKPFSELKSTPQPFGSFSSLVG